MPVKFDDIPKVATEVLNDDHQVSGYVLKAKQKTNYGGAVLSTQVDLFHGKDHVTPSKLTWKWPTPLGCGYFNIDKLEVDKSGKFKLEAASTKLYPDLKCECKSGDITDPSKMGLNYTYTGFKDTQLKLDTKALKPQDFTGEITHTRGVVTGGIKFTSKGGAPDLGIRLTSGQFFVSLLATGKFSTHNASFFYKANPDVKIAATYQHGGKANGNCTLGVAYKGLAKVKVTQDQTVSCSVKHSLAKGFTLLGGMSFNPQKGSKTCGLQLSIE